MRRLELPFSRGLAKRHTAFALAAVVLLFACLQTAGETADSGQVVDLNIVATDRRGQPVTDLTGSEIRITDNGKPQRLLFFRRIDRRLSPPAKLEPGEFSNRTTATIPHATVVLLDFLNERFSTRAIASNSLAHYLESLEAADYLYLYFLTMDGRILPVRGLDSEEPETWTRNAKALIDAATRGAVQVRPSNLDVGTRIEFTYGALNTLGGVLSRVPGRKNIVWITDGIPLELGPVRSGTGETIDFGPMVRQLSLAFEHSQMAIYPAQQIMIGSPNALSDLPGSGAGRSTAAGLDSRQTLDLFAAITGGRRDLGKDIGAAVGQAMNDARWSYRAGYAPRPDDWDRKYHKLRIASTRKGVRIQAKTGYYAWPENRSSRMKEAMRAIADTPFDAAEIGLRGAIEQTAGGGLRIRLRIEARDIIAVPGDGRNNARLDLAMLMYGEGGLMMGPATVLPINPIDLHWTDANLAQARSDGIAVVQDVQIGPAVTAVRIVVHDDNGGTTGSLTLAPGRLLRR